MMTINLFIHFRNGKNGFFPISHGWEKKNKDRKKNSIKRDSQKTRSFRSNRYYSTIRRLMVCILIRVITLVN
jgi:hypothetical protein